MATAIMPGRELETVPNISIGTAEGAISPAACGSAFRLVMYSWK